MWKALSHMWEDISQTIKLLPTCGKTFPCPKKPFPSTENFFPGTENSFPHVRRHFPTQQNHFSADKSLCPQCLCGEHSFPHSALRTPHSVSGSPPYGGGVAAASADGVVLSFAFLILPFALDSLLGLCPSMSDESRTHRKAHPPIAATPPLSHMAAA